MALSSNTFIKIYRSILNWEWYDNEKTLKLFLHLLLTVNVKEKIWHDKLIPRGARVTSYSKLAEEVGFTNKEIRTHLDHLIQTGEVAKESTSNYSVITVVNYDKYQNKRQSQGQTKGEQQGKQRANEWANEGQQLKNSKEYKEYKEYKECASARFTLTGMEDVITVPGGVRGQLTPSMLPGLDETPEERAERIRRLRE